MARDELSSWLGGFNEYKGGKGGDAGKWLSMHGARPLICDRKSGKPISVPRAAVSVSGAIQPRILARLIGLEHRENGMLARPLLAHPPRCKRTWAGMKKGLDTQVTADLDRVYERLLGLEMGEDDSGTPAPKMLTLSSEAEQIWGRFFDDHNLEAVELDGDEAAAWSKLEGGTARLALILHLARWASGEPVDPEVVDAVSMVLAITLTEWFGHEAQRVYAILGESEEQAEQRSLAERIAGKGGTMTARKLMRCCGRYRTAEAAEQALDELVKAGWGVWENDDHGGDGGRPARRFRLGRIDIDTTSRSGRETGVVSMPPPGKAA